MAAGTNANTGTNVAGGVGGGFPTDLVKCSGVSNGGFQYFAGGGQGGGNTNPSTQTAALGGGGVTGESSAGPEPARVGLPGTANTGGGAGAGPGGGLAAGQPRGL